jgi:iron-sulfur cluster assembly protein
MTNVPITISEAAAKKIKSVVTSPDGVLRIGLKSGGCAGMSYEMDVKETPTGDGTIIEAHGARIEIDPMVEMFLFGTEIDYQETLLESGFVFKNPNAVASCGCGTSVGF